MDSAQEAPANPQRTTETQQQHHHINHLSSTPWNFHPRKRSNTTIHPTLQSTIMPSHQRDGFIFWFRILAATTLICSTLACFSAFHIVAVDLSPVVQDVLGYNCSDLTEIGKELCASTERRHYSLWGVQDEFIVHRSRGLCASSSSTLSDYGLNWTGDIKELEGLNLGECTETWLVTVSIFSVLTAILACLLVVWVTIFPDHHEELYFSLRIHQWLSGTTMVCSLIVILVYTYTINPLRLDPTYCESQIFFNICEQSYGHGFWLQVSTACLCFITLISGMLARRRDILGFDKDLCHSTVTSNNDPSSCRDVCINIHFWIKMGQLGEFVLMLVGVVTSFTYITATVPPGVMSRLPNTKILRITNRVNLWEGIYCNYNVLWWSYFEEGAVQSFGHCNDSELFHVHFASVKVLISSGLALVLKRDA
jgi:hypothetical protein